MTRTWVDSDLGEQPALLAVDARDLLPAGHAAFEFIETVKNFEMSEFAAAYRIDGVGRPPFDPRLMLTLILYCWHKGKTSGREIAAACYDDLGARVITGNRYPDRSTVNGFLRTHQGAIQRLLPQTMRQGHELGLVDVGVIAGDGTYVLANAAMSATVDEDGLVAQIADLERQLAAAQQAWHALGDGDGDVDAPPILFGDDDDDDGRPQRWSSSADNATRRRVQVLSGKLRSLQAASAHMRAHPNTAVTDWEDRLRSDQDRVRRREQRLDQTRATLQASHDRRKQAEANGVKVPGPRPVPVEEHIRVRDAVKALATATTRAEATAASRPTTTRVNTTDPHSRIMPGKNDGFDQRHNLQALGCRGQFILAVTTHDSSNDKRALENLLNQGRTNLDAAGITDPIGIALFDNGYASAANFNADLPVELLLVATEKEARQTERLRDGKTTAAQAWAIMAARLEDPENRATYKRRGAIIEPVFAQLFNRFGNATHYRGDNVLTELHLWAITHNAAKIHRARRKHKPT